MPNLFLILLIGTLSLSAPALEANCATADSSCWNEWLSGVDRHADTTARLRAVTRPFDEQIEALRSEYRALVLKHNSVGRLVDLESDHSRQVYDNLAAWNSSGPARSKRANLRFL
jgi:hypothetical protein